MAALRKDKPPKDRYAPKKPPTAFFIYQMERRKLLSPEDSKKPRKEVSAMFGREWTAMSPQERGDYQEKARQAKSEYEQRCRAYKGTSNFRKYLRAVKRWEDKRARSKGNRETSKPTPPRNIPKQPQSAFDMFKEDMIQNYKGNTQSMQASVEIKRAWGALKKKGQEKWLKIFEEECIAWKKKMTRYKKSKAYKKYTADLAKWRKRTLTKRTPTKRTPTKRTPTKKKGIVTSLCSHISIKTK